MMRKPPIALVLAALLGPTLAGCQEDLGQPKLRQADWDAQAPVSDAAGTNSNNPLDLWQPECGLNGVYPCPPYGVKRGDIIPNKLFASGNTEADLWANEDGVLSLSDYYQSEAKLLFVFYGQDG